MVTITKDAHKPPLSIMDNTQRAVILGVVILLFLLALNNQHDNAESMITTASEKNSVTITTSSSSSIFDVTYKKDEHKPDLSHWEGCTIDTTGVSPLQQPKNVKTFWVSMFPSSDAGMIGVLIKLLTNSPYGHKSYYASARGLKKCKSDSSITITCEQIHPVIGIGPPPEKQTSSYQSKIFLSIRNPLTVIPAHQHSKALKYHGATTQVEIDEWRKFRDQYFMQSVKDGWRKHLTTWITMDGYDHRPIYLPMEHLLDPVKGPALTERLAQELRTAGYKVVQNTGCVWYTAVKDQWNGPNHPHFDYAESYIPALTKEIKVQLLDELNDIRTIYGKNDTSLDRLLIEYMDAVQGEKRTDDTSWVNQTQNEIHY